MNLVDHTLPAPEDNLRFDETLLERLDEFRGEDIDGQETLRFWECPSPVVVLGRGGKIPAEVHEDVCAAEGIPILRRISGGGTVVLGPGCLNYSLVLSQDLRPELQAVDRSYEIILGKVMHALDSYEIELRGLSDLAWKGQKICGNAQKRTRRAVLHQGTILYNFDSSLIARLLPLPPRQPPYRNGRTHTEFVTNIPVSVNQFKFRLYESWRK